MESKVNIMVKNKKGFSIIELLISIAIVSMAINKLGAGKAKKLTEGYKFVRLSRIISNK